MKNYMNRWVLLALKAIVILVWLACLWGQLFAVPGLSGALAQDYLPRNQATASGLTLGLAMSIGGMVAPLFGMLSDARGLRFSLSVVLCILCVAAAQAWCMRNRRSEGSAAPAAVRA